MISGIDTEITLKIDYREQRSGIISEIEKISNTGVNGLSEVHGIGQKLANNIYTIIHEPF